MEAKLARSTAGHDCGKIYVVIREEPGSVWLADGRLKTVDKPKRKNSRHVQPHQKDTGAGGGTALRGNGTHRCGTETGSETV